MHYSDVIMSATASQIIGVSIVYSIFCSSADQRKHQSSVSLGIVTGIRGSAVDSPHKGPVTRKMFLFDDVIMSSWKWQPTHWMILIPRLAQWIYYMIWKHFPHYWHFLVESTDTGGQRGSYANFWCFLCCKYTVKETVGSLWWFEIPWLSCDVSAIEGKSFKIIHDMCGSFAHGIRRHFKITMFLQMTMTKNMLMFFKITPLKYCQGIFIPK